MTEVDHTTWTGEQLVEYLEHALSSGGARNILPDEQKVLAEISTRLADAGDVAFVLPVAATELIRELTGGKKRSFDALSRRIRFAFRVWQGKYGPWSPEQADYAEELVCWALRSAKAQPNPIASAQVRLEQVVNHENTHKGFTSREARGVDITVDLMEALT